MIVKKRHKKIEAFMWSWTPRSRHYYCHIEIRKGKKVLKIKTSKFICYLSACDWIEEKMRKLLKTKKYWFTEEVRIKVFNDREME